MPMLVRTPEDIFREEKKDIYLIRNLEHKRKYHFPNQAPGMKMIQQWIEENLPGTRIELLGPSEHSGIICGGIDGTIRVDFSAEGLQKFCVRWEVNDQSVDPRFQCHILPYQRWFDKHGRFVPTREQPDSIGLCSWVHTPLGFLVHQIDLAEAQALNLQHHPAHTRDLWMHAKELWPELAVLDLYQISYGYTLLDENWAVCGVAHWRPFKQLNGYTPPSDQEIRTWLRLPDSIEVFDADW